MNVLKKAKFLLMFILLLSLVNNVNFSLGLKKAKTQTLKIDLNLYKKISKDLKAMKGSVAPLSLYNDVLYDVIVCYNKKQKNKKVIFKSKNKYCYYEKLNPIEILQLSKEAEIEPVKKVKLLMYNAIKETYGKYYLKILNETQQDIDGDGENDTLVVAIPFLNWTYKPKYNVTIAVIDTGVDLDNPWIKYLYDKGQLEAVGIYYNGTDCVVNNDFEDENGHGTFVVSEIISLNPNVKIISIKPKDLLSTDIACAIEYANLSGADIISMSLGYFPEFFDGYLDPLWNELDKINDSNSKILFSIAMGNEGNYPFHKRIITPQQVRILSVGNDTKELLVKNYVGKKLDVNFYDNGTLIGKIFYNDSSNSYEAEISDKLNFDIDGDGIQEIYYSESGYSKENNLKFYLNTSVNNITMEVLDHEDNNNPVDVDLYIDPTLYTSYGSSENYFENPDSLSTILSPATYPDAFSIGSWNSLSKVYVFSNDLNQYEIYDYTSSIGYKGDLSKFSSRGVPKVEDNYYTFEIRKPELITPGAIIFGANLGNYHYAIFNKTFNTGDSQLLVPIYNNSSSISYITTLEGTSMAAPFFSGILSILKSFFKYENRSFFRKIYHYLTFNTSFTSNYTIYDVGSGIISINKTFLILPNATLIDYKVNYTAKKLILEINLSNKLGVNYNISYFIIKINNSKNLTTQLKTGVNYVYLNLDEYNLKPNSNYTITFEGEIIKDYSYNISLPGINVSILNASVYLNLSQNKNISANLTLQLNLNYSLLDSGTTNCEFISTKNKSFNISYGINKINITLPFKKTTEFKIYCEGNANNFLNYTLNFSDFIKENEINTSKKEINLTFYKNLTLKDSLGNNYSVKLIVNNQETPYNYTYLIKENKTGTYKVYLVGNETLDEFYLNLMSNYTLDNLNVSVLIFDDNISLVPTVKIENNSNYFNPFCNLTFNLNNESILNSSLFSNTFEIENQNNSFIIGINPLYWSNFKVEDNKSYNISVILKCKYNLLYNQNLTKKVFVNSSSITKNLNFTINQSSFFDNITFKIAANNSIKEELYVYKDDKILYYLNQSNGSLYYKDLYKKINASFIYYYNFNNNFTNYNYKLAFYPIVSLNYTKYNLSLAKVAKTYYYFPPKPKVYLYFVKNNDNKYSFNKKTIYSIYLKNLENKTLNFTINVRSKFKNVSENKTLSFNESLLLFKFNGSEIESEGNFNISINISSFVPLIKYYDNFSFDTINPQITNVSLKNANKVNDSFYVNNYTVFNAIITDNHFCGSSCISIKINNDTAVVYNLSQINETSYNLTFVINNSILNYGKNNLYFFVNDTYGNFKLINYTIYFDNLSPKFEIMPENAEFYNMIILKAKIIDDYPYYFVVREKNTNETLNLSNDGNYSLIKFNCVPGTNNLSFEFYDKALNINKTNKSFSCYINIENFNTSGNASIFALGTSNKSKEVKVNYKKISFIKDNFKYLVYNYSLNSNVEFLALVFEEDNIPIERLEIWKDDNLLENITDKNYFFEKNNKQYSIFVLKDVDGDYNLISIHKSKIFDLNISLEGKVFYNQIIAKLIPINATKVIIKNLNNSKEVAVNFSDQKEKIIKIPCINGKNYLSFEIYKDNYSFKKELTAYCNNSMIKSDVPVISASLINKTEIIINDSAVPDFLNNTYEKKQILINFTNNSVDFLELKIPFNYNPTKVYLNKSNTIIYINSWTFDGSYVNINLSLKNDPILVIEGSKETSNNEDNNEDSSNSNSVNSGSSSYSSSSSSSYYSSSGGGGSYYYEDNEEKEEKNETNTTIKINNTIIFIKGFIKNKTINFNWSFLNKTYIYIYGNALVNITLKNKTTPIGKGYIIKVNSLKNASIILYFKKGYEIYLIKQTYVLLNKNFYSLSEGDKLLVIKKEEKLIPLKRTTNNTTTNNTKKQKEKVKEKKEENKSEINLKVNNQEESKTPLWLKIIIGLVIFVVIFLVIDFIDFLIKRKKGLI